jgi:hypothetical protein
MTGCDPQHEVAGEDNKFNTADDAVSTQTSFRQAGGHAGVQAPGKAILQLPVRFPSDRHEGTVTAKQRQSP